MIKKNIEFVERIEVILNFYMHSCGCMKILEGFKYCPACGEILVWEDKKQYEIMY